MACSITLTRRPYFEDKFTVTTQYATPNYSTLPLTKTDSQCIRGKVFFRYFSAIFFLKKQTIHFFFLFVIKAIALTDEKLCLNF